ncbi:MAG: dCTP deaminase [Longimicrobiales bacterium]|nr:dCTP deaminase [Longimicrobiales bacterium]
MFTNVHNVVVDSKNFDARSFADVNAKVCIIPPNSLALARTEEYFRIPRDVLVVRDFEHPPLPAKVYAGEGIAQLIFFQGDEEPEVAYADRKGKYMDQRGVTLPKL